MGEHEVFYEESMFHCDVTGNNVKEIRENAMARCRAFFGDVPFQILRIDSEAIQMNDLSVIGYRAQVRARVK